MAGIKLYSPELKKEWDDFVKSSRNGTFLFIRDYMDYHSDRFVDCSLMFYKKNKLVGLVPGNIEEGVFFSHKGLTYGGIVIQEGAGYSTVKEIFGQMNLYLKEKGVSEVVYKPVPHIYCSYPSQEDLYLLFTLNAEREACHLSSSILVRERIGFAESRESGIRKGRRAGIGVRRKDELSDFWELLSNNLQKTYKISPVHSLREITYLKSKFPEQIKLFIAELEGKVIAGTVIYNTGNVAHVQYISANEEGKQLGALDLIFEKLLAEESSSVTYFDFGSSTENMGHYINENLIFQKEGFGGRGVAYETYRYKI